MINNWTSRKLQRGAVAIEFALVVPVLLLLLVGIVDFGLVMSSQSVVANAAREGARTAALGGTTFDAQAATKSAITGLAGATNAGTKVDVTCKTKSGSGCSLEDSTPDTGGTVTVKLTYVHAWLAPVVLGFPANIPLQGKSEMRIE